MKKLGKILVVVAIIAIIVAIIVVKSKKEEKQYYIGLAQFGSHPSMDSCTEGFKEGLRREGIEEGKNLKINFQNANFDTGTTNLIANIYASENVNLVGVTGTTITQSIFARVSTKNVPVVYTAVTDPVSAGLIDGNITGTSDTVLIDQQLQLIRELLPDAKKIGVIYNTGEINSTNSVEKLEKAVGNYGFEVVKKGITSTSDIPLALRTIMNDVDCIFNVADNTVTASISTVAETALEKNIPVIGSESDQVKAGCIAANGVDYYELGVLSGTMAAKILKGEAKAEDMDYEVLKESTIYINSEYLQKLNIKIPDSIKDKAVDVSKIQE